MAANRSAPPRSSASEVSSSGDEEHTVTRKEKAATANRRSAPRSGDEEHGYLRRRESVRTVAASASVSASRGNANVATSDDSEEEEEEEEDDDDDDDAEDGSGSSEYEDEAPLPASTSRSNITATTSVPADAQESSQEEEEEEKVEEEEKLEEEGKEDGVVSTVKSISPSPPRSEVQKKNLFQRIWSNEDEMQLLGCILDYKNKSHLLPTRSEDLEFIKGCLQLQVSTSQIREKIRHLRKKFQTAAANNTFRTAHDKALHELSEKIWAGTMKPMERHAATATDYNIKFPYLSNAIKKMGLGIKRSFEVMDPGKAALLEQEVKRVTIKTMKQEVKKMDLVKESVKFVVDSL